MSENENQPAEPDNTADSGGKSDKIVFTAEQQEHVNSLLAAQKSKGRPADYDDLKAKASKFDELEQAKKSELEKLTEERDQHVKRGDAAELQVARLEAAVAKGLTETQAKRLVGNSREEFEADADELLKDLGRKPSPKPNPAQGRGEVSISSGDWLRDQVVRR